MSDNKKGGSAFIAGLIGLMAGAIGGLLLAPKSGKETREDIARIAGELSESMKTKAIDTKTRVQEIFGTANEAAMIKYKEIRQAVVDRVAAVKNAGEDIDKDKYAEIVDNVIANFKDDFKTTKTGAKKMSSWMKKDWEKIKAALASGKENRSES